MVASNLIGSRLTLLYGPSGVGKSSLLRAGVTYHLRQRAAADAENGRPDFVVVVFGSWAGDPVLRLAEAVGAAVEEALGRTWDEPPPAGSLADVLDAWSNRLGGDLLVILDQFEEYFLYDRTGTGAFAREFPEAVNRSGLAANFLVSIREDALARLDRFKDRIPELFENYLRWTGLTESAKLPIEKPLERYRDRVRPTRSDRARARRGSPRPGALRRGRFESEGRGGLDVGLGSRTAEDRVETLYFCRW
jgi:hypothetical protein